VAELLYLIYSCHAIAFKNDTILLQIQLNLYFSCFGQITFATP